MSKESTKRSPKSPKENFLKYSIGVDISMDSFDVCIGMINDQQEVKIIGTRKFLNQPKGFTQFLAWVKAKCKWNLEVCYSMEATGVYYESLAWFLHRQDFYISVVLPSKARKFMQMLGLKSKNDKIDSIGLAKMGAVQRLKRWHAPDEMFLQLRSLSRHRQSLQETRTVFSNQLHSVQHREFVEPFLVNQLKSMMDQLDLRIKEAEKEMRRIVALKPEMMARIEKITAIKGVGFISAITVLAETEGFNLFENQRQLVSFAGYDIVESSSGKHVGKTRISKKGNAHIRRILHMPGFCVVKNQEPAFKALYERVYEKTRIKMKAYVAVQRKLLVLIYTLWKNGQDYIPVLPAKLAPILC